MLIVLVILLGCFKRCLLTSYLYLMTSNLLFQLVFSFCSTEANKREASECSVTLRTGSWPHQEPICKLFDTYHFDLIECSNKSLNLC